MPKTAMGYIKKIIKFYGDASGLSSDQTYVITKVDSDRFKLSSVGVGTTAKLFYYNTNQYVNISKNYCHPKLEANF